MSRVVKGPSDNDESVEHKICLAFSCQSVCNRETGEVERCVSSTTKHSHNLGKVLLFLIIVSLKNIKLFLGG